MFFMQESKHPLVRAGGARSRGFHRPQRLLHLCGVESRANPPALGRVAWLPAAHKARRQPCASLQDAAPATHPPRGGVPTPSSTQCPPLGSALAKETCSRGRPAAGRNPGAGDTGPPPCPGQSMGVLPAQLGPAASWHTLGYNVASPDISPLPPPPGGSVSQHRLPWKFPPVIDSPNS